MTERVGLLLVHGIGEERRFEHLDQNIRPIIVALTAGGADPYVEILAANADANLAEQASWKAGTGPSVKIWARRGDKDVCINVHEVWWADVNEPTSLTKQFRFWRWGLAVWNLPQRLNHPNGGNPRTQPMMPESKDRRKARWGIYFVSSFFFVFSLTVSLSFELLRRVFGIETPDFVGTATNYLSSIKLYNQKQRWGAELGEDADYLDAMGQPPRTSIRRRMVRAIADAASAGYDRWYIFAHSLGSVVAFNALMEPAYVFPSYLDEERWTILQQRQLTGVVPGVRTGGHASPSRPPWLVADAVVSRPAIFEKFAGLVTYGSPIGKFTAIWPALVPWCREPAFQPGTPWLNIIDPIDPVAGETVDFSQPPPAAGGYECWPKKQDIFFKASNVLLYAHIKYFKNSKNLPHDYVVDYLSQWLLGGGPAPLFTGRNFFQSNGGTAKRRKSFALAQFVALFALTDLLFVSVAAAAWRFWRPK